MPYATKAARAAAQRRLRAARSADVRQLRERVKAQDAELEQLRERVAALQQQLEQVPAQWRPRPPLSDAEKQAQIRRLRELGMLRRRERTQAAATRPAA